MTPNTQTPLQPVDATEGQTLRVHSMFHTIQGEGPHVGRDAIFLRLYGCNLQCPWCDTDYTSASKPYRIESDLSELPDLHTLSNDLRLLTPIRNRLTIHNRQLLVLTGGEPYRQNIVPVIEHLLLSGMDVQIETNGTIYREPGPIARKYLGGRFMIVCSPKTPKIDPRLAEIVTAYKYVLDADHIADDGLPAGTLGKYGATARPPDNWEGDVFVQPLDEGQDDVLSLARNKVHLTACVASVLRFGYRLCIQTHKLANVP